MPSSILSQYQLKSGLFEKPHALLFTHSHTDHFDEEFAISSLKSANKPTLFCPGFAYSNLKFTRIRGDLFYSRFLDIEIYAIKTNHLNPISNENKLVVFSYIIKCGNECVYVAGDGVITLKESSFLCQYSPITYGFFNCYQLINPDTLKLINILGIKNLFLYHLPFKKDDKFSYHVLSKQLIKRFPTDLPLPNIASPMSWLS